MTVAQMVAPSAVLTQIAPMVRIVVAVPPIIPPIVVTLP